MVDSKPWEEEGLNPFQAIFLGRVRILDCAIYGQKWIGRYLLSGTNGLVMPLAPLDSEPELFKLLIDNSLQGFMIIQDERIIFVNKAVSEVSGYSQEELQSFSTNDLMAIVHPEDQERTFVRIGNLISGDMPPIRHEFRIIRKDGAIRCVDTLASGIKYRDRPAVQLAYLDITKHKQIDEAVRQSEERYRTLFNTLIEGFCVIEVIFDMDNRPIDYRFLEINPAFEKQTGLHDAMGKSMRDLASDNEAHWFEIYGKIALTGEPAHFENEAKALNRWYEVSAYRVGGPESRKVAILFNDITERKKAEERLAYQSNLLKTITDVIYSTDDQLRLTSWNHAAEKVYGWKEEEVLGRNVVEVTRSKFDPEMRARLAKALAENGSVTNEIEHMTRSGKNVVFESNTMSICNTEGVIVGYVAVNRDITERKRAEEQLAFQASLLASINDAVVATDDKFLITYWNQAAEQIYGWAAVEVLGKNSYQILGAESSDKQRATTVEMMSAGDPIRNKYVHHRKDGSAVWIEATVISLRDADGRITGYASVNRDITERKQYGRGNPRIVPAVKLPCGQLPACGDRVGAGHAVDPLVR